MQRALAGAIAERTGLDADRDMLPMIPAGAVTIVTQVAVWRWFGADPPVELRRLVGAAFRELAATFTDTAPVDSASLTTARQSTRCITSFGWCSLAAARANAVVGLSWPSAAAGGCCGRVGG